MQITLRPTGQTGTVYAETGDRATSGQRTWTRYEVADVVEMRLRNDRRTYRPAIVDVHDDGEVWVFFAQRTKAGHDFKSGAGVYETLSGLEKSGRLPELVAALRLALRFPVGAEVRNTNTGRRAWVLGVEFSPRDGVEVVQVDYRDGSAPAASSAEFTELVTAETMPASLACPEHEWCNPLKYCPARDGGRTELPAPADSPVFGDTITGTDETMGVDRTGQVVEVIQPRRYSGRTSPIYRIDTQDGWFRMVTWNGVAPIRPAWATRQDDHPSR